MRLHRPIATVLCLISGLSSGLVGEVSARADDLFRAKVEPLLQKRCFQCHSHEAKIKGGLALDSKSGWQAGGDTGEVIVPGDVEKSRLIEAVRYGDPDLAMPPKAKLPAQEIALLEQWVAMGAPDPRVGAAGAQRKGIDLEAGRKHWAFQPVREPDVPSVHDKAWPQNAVDAFVLARLESAGLRPNPDADRYTWLRRVSLDLTGLPPTPAEIAAFVNDASSEAREHVVDRLLGSKAFGERWARHWLDLVGYSDQVGTEGKIFIQHAWRYRDYLIDAFNNDKPFDRFIREQLAGDLLPADSPQKRRERLVATGFLVLGDIDINATDKRKMEMDLVDQQVSKVGIAFLGMTLGCVRCHDHKFDPISQADYYGMAGMFRSTRSTFKTTFGIWSYVNCVDLPETDDEKADRSRQLAAHEARLTGLKSERETLGAEQKQLDADIGKATADATDELKKRTDDLKARLKKLDAEIAHVEYFAPGVPQAAGVRDVDNPADMRLTIRGNPYALGDVVKRGMLRVASWTAQPGIPEGQSGRLQLANWIADPHNPLTARVAVNRIWQKLFGEGLVRSVDYFGTRGETPTHPELLDYLASRFMLEGWSQKNLIRQLVLSRVYRISSAPNEVSARRDPENLLLWRMNSHRLDAESIRDSMLAASGRLTRPQGGPALPLEYPENVTGLPPKGSALPGFVLVKTRPAHEYERTIYLPVVRTGTQPDSARLRDVFDFPQPAQITGRRSETAVPTQSLFLLNGELPRLRAADLAKGLLASESTDTGRLEQLWLRVLGRPITSEERDASWAFLGPSQAAEGAEAAQTAWTELARALFASNEFLLRR